MTNEPIVLAGRYIIVGVKCPECQKWNKTEIKTIKTVCQHCKKPIEKDISEEDKDTYEAEIIKDFAWILIKVFQTEDEIKFHVNDKHLQKAINLSNFLKIFGIEMERASVSSLNKRTGKTMLVNEITFRKSEELLYHIEKK